MGKKGKSLEDMKKSISLPAKEIVSDDEKGKKFICDVCGHKFLAPDIKWQGTPYSQPMPCPRCGSRPDFDNAPPFSYTGLLVERGKQKSECQGKCRK